MSQIKTINTNLIRMEVKDKVDPNDLDGVLRSHWVIRSMIASDPKTPLRVLYALADDSSDSVALSVARNPKTPPKLLRRLAEKLKIPELIAFHPKTTPNMLREFAENSLQAQFMVALNPKTPPDVLTTLSKTQDPLIRLALALNPMTPVITRERLSYDLYEEVRNVVLVQHFYGEFIVRRLAKKRKRRQPRGGKNQTTQKQFPTMEGF